MSQPRMHKVVASQDGRPRGRVSVAKASGDSVTCTVLPNQESQRSRSKNKIPKSVRYDLENALVSLCDVWFEEIKPHLLRNNIKVHVPGSSAGGDHQLPASLAQPAPSTDSAPTADSTTTCSHLDPGAASDRPLRQDASSAGCCPTPPTASRVPCRRLPVSSRLPILSPLPSLPSTSRDCKQTQSQNCEEKKEKRPRTCRKKRRSQPQPQSSWRVPRLCRTYSILCPATTWSHTRRIASPQPPQSPSDDYYRFIVPRRSTVMKNKSTQTEQDFSCPRVSVGCQWGAPLKSKRCSPLPGRRADAAALTSPKHSMYKSPNTKAAKESPLFRDDLIDIIGERNDKRLSLLYSSPEKNEYPSFMNLFSLPNDRQKKPGGWNKNPPWR